MLGRRFGYRRPGSPGTRGIVRRRATAGCLVIAGSVACGSTEPREESPVGRYELVGCTYGSNSSSIPRTVCQYGGSAVRRWDSASVVLNIDGSAFRRIRQTLSEPQAPPPNSWVSISTQVGVSSQEPGKVTVVWKDYGRPTTLERVEETMFRDNSLRNEYLYFWFQRSSQS